MAGYEDNTLDAETLALFANAPERFVKRLRLEGDCVVWTGHTMKNGYGTTWDGKSQVALAHRMSYLWHYGELPSGLDVMHSCDRRNCVSPKHLSAGTRKQNMQDCVSKDRQVRGSRNGQAKLTELVVADIKRRHSNGEMQSELAREYRISPTTLCGIVKGRTWRHVQGV